MKNKCMRTFLATLLIFVCLALPAFADDYLYDMAGYLTEEQAQTLEGDLADAFEELTAAIRIVTEDEMSSDSAEDTAKAYYDELNDTGKGELPGVLLYVCRSERVYYVEASANVFNDDMITYLEDAFLPYMREDDYYGAFCAYLAEAKKQITANHGDSPHFPVDPYPDGTTNDATVIYDDDGYDSASDDSFSPTDLVYLLYNPYVWLFVIVLPLLVALFLTYLKVKQMNTAVKKTTASGFVKNDSLNVKEAHEIYLYSTVVATPKPKDPPKSDSDSGFSGSSGSSGRVGHGGSF